MANETAVTKKSPAVLDLIQAAKTNFVTRLPKGTDAGKFIMGIMTAVQKSKANADPGKSLADCDPQSVLLAAYDAAEVGCSLSPALALGWLIPYGKECNFQPSYRFFIQKAYETNEVKTFYAEVVYEGDTFDRQFAPVKNLFHAPGKNNERTLKTRLGAYAFIQFSDGTVDWEYLTNEQIDRHRNASKQKNSMKWTTFWEEGWRITPIRVLAKRLPLKNRDLERLVEIVNDDASRDLVIPLESIQEPSVPRRMSETQKPAEAPAEKTGEEKPTEKPVAESSEQAEKPKEQPPATNGTPANMFAAEEADPYITAAQISEFWTKVFAVPGQKKSDVVDFIKKTFKVEALKDLRVSQMNSAIDTLTQARE